MLFMLITSHGSAWIVGIFLFNLILNLFLIVSYFRSRHYFDDEAITFGRVVGSPVRVEWRDIKAVEFSNANYAFVFKSSRGSHQIPTGLAGVVEFAEAMRHKLPVAIFNDVAVDKLSDVENGQKVLPPESGEPLQTWKAELIGETKKSFGKPAIRRWVIFMGLMMTGMMVAMEGWDFAMKHGVTSSWAAWIITVLGLGIPGFITTRL